MYAMRQTLKTKVKNDDMQDNQIQNNLNTLKKELEIIVSIEHDFILNTQYAFHDAKNFYMVMDLYQGGSLRDHHINIKKLPHEQTQFFIACLILALEYVHAQGIIHRDVKPENLIFDKKGYLRLACFKYAAYQSPEIKGLDTGTPGYSAPEVMYK